MASHRGVVSVADLTGAIGIASPSLYAAFGSKAGLCREALDRYAALPGALDGMTGAATLQQAVSGLLGAAIRAVIAEEPGCMISTRLIEAGMEHQKLAGELAERRRSMRDRIEAALSQWIDRPDAERLATYLLAILQGISVQARDGATKDESTYIADEAGAGITARRNHRS